MLIELNARMCGAMLPRLAEEAMGQNQVELSLMAYLQPQLFSRRPDGYTLQKNAGLVFLQSQGSGGRMSHQHLEALEKLAGVHRVELFFNEGVVLPRTTDADNHVGRIELLHTDQATLRQTAATIREWERLGYFETR